MRKNAPSELITITAEDSPKAKRLMKATQLFLRDPVQVDKMGLKGKNLPLQHIIDTISFAEKTETSLLQIADACAFAIKRKAMKTEDADRFFKPFERQLVWTIKFILEDGAISLSGKQLS